VDDAVRGLPGVHGAALTAYAYVNRQLGGAENPDFNLRELYPTTTSTTLRDWATDIADMSAPDDVPTPVWNEVTKQLTTELGNAANVASWYDGYLETMAQNTFEIDNMDKTASLISFSTGSDLELEMAQWDIVEGILDGFETLDIVDGIGDAAVVANSLIGGMLTAESGADGVSAALDGIEGTYLYLQGQLQASFENAIEGNTGVRMAIQKDYGLQSAVGGELIGTGTWTQMSSTQQKQVISSAGRNYALGVWQTIVPSIWIAYSIPAGGGLQEYWCDGECDWYSPDGTGWVMAYPPPEHGTIGDCPLSDSTNAFDGPCKLAPAAARSALFQPTSASCQATWNFASCNVGESPGNVFLGYDGWQRMPLRQCTYDSGLNCPSSR
jgi:hypothetical protein